MEKKTYKDIIKNLYGFDQIYKKVEDKINKKSDLAILLFHYNLIVMGMFNIGTGTKVKKHLAL